MTGAATRFLTALSFPLVLGCAQTLVYEVSSDGAATHLADERRTRGWPFIGNRNVDREAKRLPAAGFGKVHAGSLERVSCWRMTTQDGATFSASDWTLKAVLRDHVVLYDEEKPATRVIDAEDLGWIEAPREFDVRTHGNTVRAQRIEREPGGWRITDYFGKTHRPRAGELAYAPPKTAPPDEVYGLDAEGRAWPLDFVLIRGFVEGADSAAVVFGTYRTVPASAIARWEFDKEWGPWSTMLAPYLAGRWIFTNKAFVARCEQFP